MRPQRISIAANNLEYAVIPQKMSRAHPTQLRAADSRELEELSQIARQNSVVLRPHKAATQEQAREVTDILRELTVHKAAQLLQLEPAAIVEVQHFRTDHVRIRLREAAAVRAAHGALKADTGIYVGSDLSVGARQQTYEAAQALSRAGYTAKMAGSMVKYKDQGLPSSQWQYVNPRDRGAILSLTAAAADEHQHSLPLLHQQQQLSQNQMKQGRQQQLGHSRVPKLGHLGERDITAGVRPPKKRRKQQKQGKPAKFRNPQQVMDSGDSLVTYRSHSNLNCSHGSYNSLEDSSL